MISEERLKRDVLVDALRGVAVLGMVIAHAIFFFHTGTNIVLNTIQQLLNMTMFTFFIFVSGNTISLWWNLHEDKTLRWRQTRLFQRFSVLYIGYIIVAIVAIVLAVPSFSIVELSSRLLEAVFLFHPPNFTEYVPTFILLTLSLIVGEKLYRTIQMSFIKTIFFSLFVYVLGFILYPVSVPSAINLLKLLLVGQSGHLTFPLLFYVPVFFLGIWWQHELKLHKKIAVMCFFLTIATFSIFVSNLPGMEAFGLTTRWPPSPGFLTMGIILATILSILLPLCTRKSWTSMLYLMLIRIGQDAFTLWSLHIVLLFLYQKFVGNQYNDVFMVILALFLLVVLCGVFIILTTKKQLSIITVGLQKPLIDEHKKISNRYIVLTLFAGIFFVFILKQLSSASIYGDVMEVPQVILPQHTIPINGTIVLSTNRSWYLRSYAPSKTIEVTTRLTDENQNLFSLPASAVTLFIDDLKTEYQGKQISEHAVIFEIPTQNIPSGSHSLYATLLNNSNTISNVRTTIQVSEPVFVAWTFDWEGWDVPDITLQQIEYYSLRYNLPFTHFVSPRTFIEGVLSPERKEVLVQFLKHRHELQDEIAMHLHMHFDYVSLAGIEPIKKHPWGFRSQEGYDIPTQEYSPEQFRTLIQFGLTVMNQVNLPTPQGYRAGGWFLNTRQLQILEEEGFQYDSSAREKPTNGAFRTIGWSVTGELQPYYPDDNDQNSISEIHSGIMEIPNNGGNTYEYSVEELIENIRELTDLIPREKPTTVVIVSHPQFSDREFNKIPNVLSTFQPQLFEADTGPVVFVTMSEILESWKSYLQ